MNERDKIFDSKWSCFDKYDVIEYKDQYKKYKLGQIVDKCVYIHSCIFLLMPALFIYYLKFIGKLDKPDGNGLGWFDLLLITLPFYSLWIYFTHEVIVNCNKYITIDNKGIRFGFRLLSIDFARLFIPWDQIHRITVWYSEYKWINGSARRRGKVKRVKRGDKKVFVWSHIEYHIYFSVNPGMHLDSVDNENKYSEKRLYDDEFPKGEHLLIWNDFSRERIEKYYKGHIADIRGLPGSRIVYLAPESKNHYKSLNMIHRINYLEANRMVNGEKRTFCYRSGRLIKIVCSDKHLDFRYKGEKIAYVKCSVRKNDELKYTLDDMGNIISLSNWGTVYAEYVYDNEGQLTSMSGEYASLNPLREKGMVTDKLDEIEELMPSYVFVEDFEMKEEDRIHLDEKDFRKEEVIIDGIKHVYGYGREYLLFDAYEGHTDYFKYDEFGIPYFWIHQNHNYYFRYDPEGRMEYLVDDGWNVVARYVYDTAGNLIHTDGELAMKNPLKHLTNPRKYPFTLTRWDERI